MSDWRPGSTRAALHARAALLAKLRQFFADRQVLEVDTPLIAPYGVTDPAIEPLRAVSGVTGKYLGFLQTSPEFAMKRLLADGSGAIYQLGKVFRDGEVGARHNPEFTLLEWYRPGFSLEELMQEVAELVCECLQRETWHVTSYQALFKEQLAIDPWHASEAALKEVAHAHLDIGDLDLDYDGWLDLLMSHLIEPALASRGLQFVYDYPASQAALAQSVVRDGRQVAERFELYVDGIELANGYRELRDASTLRERAERDNARRLAAGQEARVLDPKLLAAMEAGLPDCSGVALGVDRLLMAQLQADHMSAVMAFDWQKI